MGCCVSSNRASSNRASASSVRKNQDFVVDAQSKFREKASESRAPPPVEEETVKEVLSETPKWKLTIAKLEPEKPPQNLAFDEFEGDSKVEKALPAIKAEEISEVSEVCSLSETMSKTTITDQREEGEEIRQRVNRSPARMQKNRSFSGDNGGKRKRPVGKSPARRSAQSPGPRNAGSARLVQSRDQTGQSTMGNGRMRNQPHRRDPSENSGRRSRSPATRADNGAARSAVGRSPSARRTTRSPARVRTAMPESEWPSAHESLEKPLVSLECFIFL